MEPTPPVTRAEGEAFGSELIQQDLALVCSSALSSELQLNYRSRLLGGGLEAPGSYRRQGRLCQQGMPANVFQPAHGSVRTDPNFQFDGAMQLHFRRNGWICGIFAGNNPALLRGGDHAAGQKDCAQRNLQFRLR